MASFDTIKNIYSVFHQVYATDHYEYSTTLVVAESAEGARKKLNDWIATAPYGGYTPLPCQKLEHVSLVKVLN